MTMASSIKARLFSSITHETIVQVDTSNRTNSCSFSKSGGRAPMPGALVSRCSSSGEGPSRPSLAKVWREIQGTNNWRNMVCPLHPVLRDEIVRYGELVNACYKAFDLDPKSPRYLTCKYGRRSIFEACLVENPSGYEVTKYVYAHPGVTALMQSPCNAGWVGFVAVSSDAESRRLGRRDIVISFRGTVTDAEWLANFMSSLTPARLNPHDPQPDVKVESGFLSMYTSGDPTCKFSEGSCREQLLRELSRLISHHRDEDVSITLAGHSMGSSLAILLAYDLAELGLNVDGKNRRIPITVYSFAGPRVGNIGFKERCEELGVKVLRVVNVNDPVTKLPGMLMNEGFRVLLEKLEIPWSACSCYAHVGVELALDFFTVRNPVSVHDLEHYLGFMRHHDGVKNNGEKGEFLRKMSIDEKQWTYAAVTVSNFVQSLGF